MRANVLWLQLFNLLKAPVSLPLDELDKCVTYDAT